MQVSYNQLRYIPESIFKCKKLRKITLNHNMISSLPECFEYMHDLEVIWLMDNRLTRLPGELGFLKKLKELCVCYFLFMPSFLSMNMDIENKSLFLFYFFRFTVIQS